MAQNISHDKVCYLYVGFLFQEWYEDDHGGFKFDWRMESGFSQASLFISLNPCSTDKKYFLTKSICLTGKLQQKVFSKLLIYFSGFDG